MMILPHFEIWLLKDNIYFQFRLWPFLEINPGKTHLIFLSFKSRTFILIFEHLFHAVIPIIIFRHTLLRFSRWNNPNYLGQSSYKQPLVYFITFEIFIYFFPMLTRRCVVVSFFFSFLLIWEEEEKRESNIDWSCPVHFRMVINHEVWICALTRIELATLWCSSNELPLGQGWSFHSSSYYFFWVVWIKHSKKNFSTLQLLSLFMINIVPMRVSCGKRLDKHYGGRNYAGK